MFGVHWGGVMLVQRIEMSDDQGNKVEITPCNGIFALHVHCAQVNGGRAQSVFITVPMLRQLTRLLKFLEVKE